MPKKFTGQNIKAVEARERKENIKNEKKLKEAITKEDAYWEDNDKQVQRKLQRKQEEEDKRLKILERKQLNKKAYEDEINSIVTSNKNLPSSLNYTTKVTLAQIESRNQESIQKKKEEEELLLKMKNKLTIEDEISENLNHLRDDEEVATSVDDAIKILDSGGEIDMHPEKRLKSAFAKFEEYRLVQLKIEHPTFRLSQLKKLLKKEWMKSPENPLNKKILNIIK